MAHLINGVINPGESCHFYSIHVMKIMFSQIICEIGRADCKLS